MTCFVATRDFLTAHCLYRSNAEERSRITLHLLATLEILSVADIFVGTYSSNVGRLTTVLRAAKGKHPSTAYSVDVPNWHSGRNLEEGLSD